MSDFKIASVGDQVVITVDRSLMPMESLNWLFERLRVEQLIQQADFSEDVVNISAEITEDWWRQHRAQYLEGIA